METNMVYNITIMELIQKEDKPPFVDYYLWKKGLCKAIEKRAERYRTISMCLECDRLDECDRVQVEATGFYRYVCGIKNREWRK